MSFKVYINGSCTTREDAKISVYDHGLLYGDGVFEGMRSYGGKVFRLQEHLDRLWHSAKAIWLEIPMTQREMAQAVERHAGGQRHSRRLRPADRHARRRHAGLDPNRVQRSAGDHHRRHHQRCIRRSLRKGLEIITVSTMRNHPAALSPRIKSLNYLNNILAKIEGCRPAASKP
jgi:branched-chain amino acid aminotransferase